MCDRKMKSIMICEVASDPEVEQVAAIQSLGISAVYVIGQKVRSRSVMGSFKCYLQVLRHYSVVQHGSKSCPPICTGLT